jgi:AcrR family transcriptional regulator
MEAARRSANRARDSAFPWAWIIARAGWAAIGPVERDDRGAPAKEGNLNRSVLIDSDEMARARARIDHTAVAAAFAPDGLHGVTAADVARHSSIAKATLYARGGSKEAIFLACVEAEVERLLDALYEADLRTRRLSCRQRVAAQALAVIQHGHDHPAAARLLHVTAHHRSSAVALEVDAALARLPARVAVVLRRDTTDVRAEQVAVALMGAASALALNRPADAVAAGQLLGDAFAVVLESEPSDEEERVRSIGVY